MNDVALRGIEVAEFGTVAVANAMVLYPSGASDSPVPAQYGVDHALKITLANRSPLPMPLTGWQVFFRAPRSGRIRQLACDPSLVLAPGQEAQLPLGQSMGVTRVPLPPQVPVENFDAARMPPLYRGIRPVEGAVALLDPGNHRFLIFVFEGGGGQDLEALTTAVQSSHPGAMMAGAPVFDYSFEALVTRRLGGTGPGALGRTSWAASLPGGAAPFIYDPGEDPAPSRAGFDPDYDGPVLTLPTDAEAGPEPASVTRLFTAASGVARPPEARPPAMTPPAGFGIPRTPSAAAQAPAPIPPEPIPPEPIPAVPAAAAMAVSEAVLRAPTIPVELHYRCVFAEGQAASVLPAAALDQVLLHMRDLGVARWAGEAEQRCVQIVEPYLREGLTPQVPFHWSRAGTVGERGMFELTSLSGVRHEFLLIALEGAGAATPVSAEPPAPAPPAPDPTVLMNFDESRLDQPGLGALTHYREYADSLPFVGNYVPKSVLGQLLQVYHAAMFGAVTRVEEDSVLTLIRAHAPASQPVWLPEFYSMFGCGFRTSDGVTHVLAYSPPADNPLSRTP